MEPLRFVDDRARVVRETKLANSVGTEPSNIKFVVNDRVFRRCKSPISDGIKPEIELVYILNVVNPPSNPISDGMVPCNLFAPRSRWRNILKFPMYLGKKPESLFACRRRSSNLVKLESSSGRVEFSRFVSMRSVVRDVKAWKSFGIEPEILFPDKSKNSRLLSSPISVGIIPTIPPFDERSNDLSSINLPICVGIFPLIICLLSAICKVVNKDSDPRLVGNSPASALCDKSRNVKPDNFPILDVRVPSNLFLLRFSIFNPSISIKKSGNRPSSLLFDRSSDFVVVSFEIPIGKVPVR
mmetsp:Transcript_17700/g.26853  ORF Transcript_17700/g.26853 Transcript_17700/m.26853 type:complete len:298 (-) Transcript_17700:2583-3476(-)